MTQKTSDGAIPEAEQIDAILSGRIWNLVHRYCNGAWNRLPACWTASFVDILAEGRRRGLGSFVMARSITEGYWLASTESGYATFYWERGIRMYEGLRRS
ncbi:hypothetical protein [Cupriavidus sp. IDO]|uniref:hypothetical protein n=1 Tax=Cupriavidus sp. IDO TaxID=1539142 RepID=UPI001269EBE0|nr:hypothetical protein [Cupriavidus sp. IDO]